jgi:hypothetical protein
MGPLDSQFCALKGEEQRGKRERQGACSKSVSARRQKSELTTASLRPDRRYTRDARATLSYQKMSWSLDQQKKQSSCGVKTEFHLDKSEISRSILRPKLRKLSRAGGRATLPSLRATKFEFEKRFWIICAIYFVGFFLSGFDHTPFIVALRHSIAQSIARAAVWMPTHSRGPLSRLARCSCF